MSELSRGKRNIKYKKHIGRQCKAKNRYKTESDVRRAIKGVQRHKDIDLDFYYCNNCNGFHMTSKTTIREAEDYGKEYSS